MVRGSWFFFTPSFGAGYYDDGDGKKLGHNIEFRTTLEISYQLKSKNRISFQRATVKKALELISRII